MGGPRANRNLMARKPGPLFAFALASISLIGPLCVHIFLPVLPSLKESLGVSEDEKRMAVALASDPDSRLDPAVSVLIAATNSSGGVMGKMISPQNISTGCSTTNLKGQEGVIFARTFKHSVILTLLLGLLVLLQQYVFPWMIPG